MRLIRTQESGASRGLPNCNGGDGAQAGWSEPLPSVKRFISLSQTVTNARKCHQVQEQAEMRVNVPGRPLKSKGQEMRDTAKSIRGPEKSRDE